MILFYNCSRPIEVLRSGVIKPSKVHGGVSFSSNFNMASHGPFKIQFMNPRWEKLLKQCLYMSPVREVLDGRRFRPITGYTDQFDRFWSEEEYRSLQSARIAKNDMFRDEAEWWCPTEIAFEPKEVTAVYFMVNAPRVQPIIAQRARRELRAWMPNSYTEVTVRDPYLQQFA